jgi:hypothetical protein
MTSFIPNWFDKVGEEEGVNLYFTAAEHSELTILESRVARIVRCRTLNYDMERDYDSMMWRIDQLYKRAANRSTYF